MITFQKIFGVMNCSTLHYAIERNELPKICQKYVVTRIESRVVRPDVLSAIVTFTIEQEQAAETAKLKSNWISVRDQLPPIDRRVLFCCAIVCDFSEVDIGQFDGGWMGSKNAVAMELDGGDWGPCSHWRELPEPPKK